MKRKSSVSGFFVEGEQTVLTLGVIALAPSDRPQLCRQTREVSTSLAAEEKQEKTENEENEKSRKDNSRDGVEEPENGEDESRGHVGLGVVGAELGDRSTSVDEEDLPDTDEGEASETEECPLVTVRHEGTDETGDDL